MLKEQLIVKAEPVADKESMVEEGNVRVTVLLDRLFRVEVSPEGKFCDMATQSVWYRKFERVPFTVTREGEELRIATEKATLFWNGSRKESFVSLAEDPDGSGRKRPLCNEGNLLGTYRTLDCCDGGRHFLYEKGEWVEEPVALEFGVASKSGVAILEDGMSLVLKEDGMLGKRPWEEEDFYVFAFGRDYRAAVKALFAICGGTPKIPRFALGNWWSRYHAYTEKEYLHTMDDFEKRDIPLTVATVDMDWHWSTTLDYKKQIAAQGKNDAFHGGNNGWTGYSWNTDLFPDYKRFLRKLHQKGLHVTLNLHPADGVRYFEDSYPQMAEAMGINPETEERIAFDIADARFVNAYFEILHHPYEEDGVDFWWIDWQQGSQSRLEGLDPLWALNHYHFLDNGARHEPLILSRYCGIGSHRYPLGFSGDTMMTWESLKYLPYFTATASNAGYCWWSHDIGGHMSGYKEDELYVRFVQFGVFSPIMRLHCTDMSVLTKEPWAYGNGAGLIAEEYLRLRHQMIPFLYSASVNTAEAGLALIEPLYYAWPDKEEAYRYPEEYLFGGELLVAPITQKSEAEGMAGVAAWLPKGRWTDLFTKEEYQGGRELTMVRWLEEMPVLLKEGGFFVLDDRKRTNDTSNPERLKVYVANGSGSYTLHEDQENGQKKERINTTFVSKEEDGCQKVSFFCSREKEELDGKENEDPNGLAREGKEAKETLTRRYEFLFCNITSGEVAACANGKPYPATVDDNGRLSVVLEETVPGVAYEICVRYKEENEKKRKEQLQRIMTKLQMDNHCKEELFGVLCDSKEEARRKAIKQAELPEIAKKKLLEVLN